MGFEVYETIGLLKSPCDSGGSYFQYSHGNYVLRSSFAHVPVFQDLERLLDIGILGNELSCFEQFGKSVLQITGMTIDQTKILMQKP